MVIYVLFEDKSGVLGKWELDEFDEYRFRSDYGCPMSEENMRLALKALEEELK